MLPTVPAPRKVAYALVVLSLFAVARFNLGPCLLAGLFSYMILNRTDRLLLSSGVKPFVARWCSLGLFIVVAGLLIFIFAAFIRLGLERLPILMDRVLPRLDELAARVGLQLPIDNTRELRDYILSAAKENAQAVSKTSGLLTRGFFQIVVGIAVAVLRFLSPEPAPLEQGHLYSELHHEGRHRAALFIGSFERVMGAQIVIAAINALATAVFLISVGMPFLTFLVLATFICGMVPIAGNIVSNVVIVAAALTRSNHLAVAALVFLVAVHKAEYFLNSRIVGARIHLPMWATLLALLVGEALLGVPGVILAPTLLYYVREELRLVPPS
ncbi:MAG: hypothetical protein A2V88_14785 [Elusimicrobia bacterium RBG_16_66_12]|nr:MAG: hypothetical protein A2V88_14785 [Elusimicrobia bacterium RBG_16_66_12]